MPDSTPKRLTPEEVGDLRDEARRHSMWAREALSQPDEEDAPFELSAEDLGALEAHNKQMAADIEAGRFHPGERRCVTLPSGNRFYLAHPDPGEEPAPRRSWWKRLMGMGRG